MTAVQDEAVEAEELALAGHDLLTRGMLDRAAALAARACTLDPDCIQALKLAAEVARAEGDLAGAAEAARLWQQAVRDEESTYSALLLNGHAVPEPPPPLRTPAPFVVEDGFLSGVQQELIASHVLDNLDRMEEASVVRSGESARDEGSRSARVLYDPRPLEDWFSPLVLAYLPWALPRLGLAPFAVSQVELQVTASYHGDFYKAHHDVTLGERDSVAGRRVSFVYYFQLPGGGFAGGALRLYDGFGRQGTDTRERFTAILPVPNRLVVFRSEALHEVMPVEARSGRAEDGRFTLNGWIHGEGTAPDLRDDRL